MSSEKTQKKEEEILFKAIELARILEEDYSQKSHLKIAVINSFINDFYNLFEPDELNTVNSEVNGILIKLNTTSKKH